MAAITFLMSSLARLRVSARTDRPDMAAAGAAGAGALLPRHRESRASRAAQDFFFFNKFIYSFIYFWLHWVFVAVRGLLIVVASLVAEHGL